MISATPLPGCALPNRHSDAVIARRIAACPKLASLQCINRALGDLVHSERTLNSQIAAVIRRDPSLAARLLRMVNSVYYGLSTRVNSIEEAVFFLGLRQIRELALATPVIEEIATLQRTASASLPWKELWRHSIGVAIISREILTATSLHIDDDTDYLVGLLHNVGKVVMAYAFPDELYELTELTAATPEQFAECERERIGWDHARIGAHYLHRHQLSTEIVDAVAYHHAPDRAPRHQFLAAAVQVADHLVRWRGISGGFEKIDVIRPEAWVALPGWRILFGTAGPESTLARAALANSLERLPTLLQGLI